MSVDVSVLVYSSCNRYCDPRELELMDEVEYCIVRKNKKLAADEIKKLPRGTIPTDVSYNVTAWTTLVFIDVLASECLLSCRR